MYEYVQMCRQTLILNRKMRVYFKMSSGSAKFNGMFCPITSASVENKKLEFSMEIAAISEAKSGFPNYNED